MGMNRTIIKNAIPPTIVVTAIFFLNYFLFGMENTLIGPFLTLSFLKFKRMEDYRGCMLRSFGIYSVMAVVAYLALLHPVLNVLCNAAALFWIGYFLIDEYDPLNYFPAGMALIFFQISPVPGYLLPKRILALAVSFGIVFLFLVLTRWLKKQRKGSLEQLAEEGIKISEDMIVLLRNGEFPEAEELRVELCKINRQISLQLYERNRSSLKKELKENVYCSYIACFQMLSYLANAILEGQTGESRIQLQQMEQLLKEFQQRDREHGNKENVCMTSRQNRSKENVCMTSRQEGITERLHFRENPVDIRSFRLRFALRQVIVMTPCLAYGFLSPWENGYWLAISVFFMMIPVYENTFSRVAQRIWGSVFGIAVCLVAFAVFHGFWARVLLMTIANFFIYCSGNYTAMVTCITCSALALNFGTDSYVLMLGQRLVYTLAGAVIAISANLWVMPIRAWRQCQYVMELLDELKRKVKAVAEQSDIGQKSSEQYSEMNRIMVKSYLLSSRMKEFNDIASVEHKRQDVDAFLKEHMLYVSKHMLLRYIKKGK